MISILLSLSYIYALFMFNVKICIICIVYDLGTLKVARNSQIMNSLQVDMLFMIGLKTSTIHLKLVHYFLIWGMIYLGRDEFPIINALVYIVTLWTRLLMSYAINY